MGEQEHLFYEVRREHATSAFYPQFVFEPWKTGNDEDALLVDFLGPMRGDTQKFTSLDASNYYVPPGEANNSLKKETSGFTETQADGTRFRLLRLPAAGAGA